MVQTVSITSVRDVRLGTSGSFVVAGKDHAGIEIDLIFRAVDAQNIAGPILCCAAMEAAAFGPKLPAATIVSACHLPVMNWQVGRSNINAEPVLILNLSGGARLTFQFAPQSAQACGQALATEGIAAGPAPGAKAN
jgi:hypothetical protein